MNPHDQLAYATFGKKDGFQFFSKTGFIEQDPELSYHLEAFAALDLNKIIPPDEKGLISFFRLQHKSARYFFFGRFYPARDAFNRPGYFGSVIILKDYYVKELTNMVSNLESLALYAKACVNNQQLPHPQLEDLTLVPYPLPFPVAYEGKPTLIKITPGKETFLKMAFLNQLGNQASEVYFSEAPDLMEKIDPFEFRVLNYEELIQEKHQQLLVDQTKLEREIGVLKDHFDELSIELDKDRVYLAKLEAEIKNKRKENDDLSQNVKSLEIKESDLQNRIVFLEQQLKDSQNKLIQLQQNEQKWSEQLTEKIAEHKQKEDEIKMLKAEKALYEKNIMELTRKKREIIHNYDTANDDIRYNY